MVLDTSLPFYEPANGVPRIPTANSAHTKRKRISIPPQIRILFLIVFTFLKTSSHNNPVPNSKTPIIAKSRIFQSTSDVSCIAIKGIDNSVAAVDRIMVNLLFAIVFVFKVRTLFT